MLQKINKKEKYFFIYFLIFIIGLFIFIKFRNNQLTKNGIFVLAQVDGIQSTKNGMSYSCHYYFKNKKHEFSFGKVGLKLLKGDIIYVKISKNNPSIYDVLSLTSLKVPSCLSMQDVPPEGWQELPKDICQ